MTSPIEAIRRDQPALEEIRRDIHAHPEMGLEEHRTAALVARKLQEWGLEVHRGIGRTGVVGVLRSGNGNRALGLRADMDALPMEEMTDLPFRSTVPGKMHACGHDGHTTMLLGAAKYLAETRRFDGTVHFIFQPGEEGCGGALAMLEDGLFERFPCDTIYGLHNRTGMDVGTISTPRRRRHGRRRVLRHHHHRQGLARRPAGDEHRPGADRLPPRHRAAVDRVPQRQPARPGRCQRHEGGGRGRLQRNPAERRDLRHRALLRPAVGEQIEAAMRRLAEGIAAGFGATAELDCG